MKGAVAGTVGGAITGALVTRMPVRACVIGSAVNTALAEMLDGWDDRSPTKVIVSSATGALGVKAGVFSLDGRGAVWQDGGGSLGS